jgi:hypothetical protein
MRRRLAVPIALFALAGCGSSGIEGVFEWAQPPRVGANSLQGTLHNTTSHSEDLSTSAMRLLDDRGRKVVAKFHAGATSVPAHGSTTVTATWKSGTPVRFDYGAGALALPSK